MESFEQIKRHHDAFWANSHIDRCCLYIRKLYTEDLPPQSLEQQWLDIPFRCRQDRFRTERTEFFADAYPCTFINLGPCSLSEAIGRPFALSDRTVWFELEPFLADLSEGGKSLTLNKESTLFRLAEEYILQTVRTNGYVPSIPDLGGVTDVLCTLRGTQDLLADLYDDPEGFMAYTSRLQVLWVEAFRHFTELLMKESGLMTSWLPVLSDVPFSPIQCDFCGMISPDMFREFILPELKYLSEHTPRSIYHLDGVDEIKHLDAILSLPGINAIQWIAGAGKANTGDPQWFDLYHRIQAGGKGLVLLDVDPNLAEGLFRELSHDGLFLRINCEDEAQANELIRAATGLAHSAK
ncbi:MAG: hypothetical protein E7486_03525 [Ruminococcaceae bacterium]|nr:hypothetical protein [Oscillospiraceae bacterium]